MLKNIYNKLLGDNTQRLNDIHAYNLIERYMPNCFFPVSNSSLNFHSIATILNDIFLNQRKNILEFGSGISTIIIAKFIISNNINATINTVDHDNGYLAILRGILEKEGLSNVVNIIYSPISKTWYDTHYLDSGLNNDLIKIDTVIIDGPISSKSNDTIRSSAFDYIRPILNDRHSIFLDDINRVAEYNSMIKQNQMHKMNFRKISPTLAMATKGDIFNPIP